MFYDCLCVWTDWSSPDSADTSSICRRNRGGEHKTKVFPGKKMGWCRMCWDTGEGRGGRRGKEKTTGRWETRDETGNETHNTLCVCMTRRRHRCRRRPFNADGWRHRTPDPGGRRVRVRIFYDVSRGDRLTSLQHVCVCLYVRGSGSVFMPLLSLSCL